MNTQYPESPGYKTEDPSTSKEAAIRTMPEAARLRELTYESLCRSPKTADEVAYDINYSILSVRPRLSELRRQGRIEPTGRRRNNASGHSAAEWKPVPVQTELPLCAGIYL